MYLYNSTTKLYFVLAPKMIPSDNDLHLTPVHKRSSMNKGFGDTFEDSFIKFTSSRDETLYNPSQ